MTEEEKDEELEDLEDADVEKLSEQLKQKDEELETVKKELLGLRNKDFNYKKLRDMTEKETEKLTEQEMELIARQEKLEEEQKTWSESLIETHKNDALNVFAGDDAEFKKKILFHYDRIKDEAKTKDEVASKMRDAYHIASAGQKGGLDPVARAAGTYSGQRVVKTSKKWTDEDMEFASKFGLSEEDIKKYAK